MKVISTKNSAGSVVVSQNGVKRIALASLLPPLVIIPKETDNVP
jgi:hypothetical protein